MEQEGIRILMAKRQRLKEESATLKEYVKYNVNEDILKFRKRIQLINSDLMPSIIGDVQDGYSPIVLVCGRQRIGKTRFGCTLANIFSVFLYFKWWDHENSFFIDPKSMLRGISDAGYQILILDECGFKESGLNKHEWWSNMSSLFDYCLQTQGFLRNIYIFVLPQAPDVVLDVRKYIDYVFGGRKKGEFKASKIYKKEDQLVRDLKKYKQVWIENLTFRKSDLPDFIWEPIEKKVNQIKMQTRIDKIEAMEKKDDWLSKGFGG
jgi:hypothetical protein